jgi:hypothetical protein
MRRLAVVAAISIAGPINAETVIGRMSCLENAFSAQEMGSHSFQSGAEQHPKPFTVIISTGAPPDNLWCSAEVMTYFTKAYCALPYMAEDDLSQYYGDDKIVFRGLFPYDYLILFEDGTFLRSNGLQNGVVVSSGTCSPTN